ncbi:unnamed protein product [Cladocopium goreaui]|uniref:PPM-type phosphatase domain-containing protein n=1 Tax=Cladocopium goreaui TaxID=2562237 RepID=A0A9P1G976_9DINO|nr:unnamed protein product [Cladocopium goreaui]
MGGVLEKPNTKKCSESGFECGPLRLTWVASAMQGWRVSMEDAHIALPVTLPRRPSSSAPWTQTALFGVLDGHGGAQVARFSSDHLPEELRKFPLDSGAAASIHKQNEQMEKALRGAFHKIDDLLRSGHFAAEVSSLTNQPRDRIAPSPRNGDATMVGCTACVCCVTSTQIVTANAGDSRAVLCSAGKAVALSEDHKPNAPREKQRIEAAGGWVENSGPNQYRVNGNLNLSRALGDLEYKKDTSRPPEEQIICSTPDVTFRDRDHENDEFLIICCDGVWDVKTNQQVVDFIRHRLPSRSDERALEQVLEDLLDACVSPDLRETGGLGGDNMTAVLVVLRSLEAPDAPSESDSRPSLAKVQLLAERSGQRHRVAKASQDTKGWLQVRLRVPGGTSLNDLNLFVSEEKAQLQLVVREGAGDQASLFELKEHLPQAARLQSITPARFVASSGHLRLELSWTA